MGEYMTNVYVKDLIKICNGTLLVGNENKEIKECFVNSKLVTLGGTFFGIKGNKTDGSLYYKEAIENGASICILSKNVRVDETYKDKTIVLVDDVFGSLNRLASYKRNLFKGEVVGITGSVGKTSTKEMVSNVLEKKYKVLKTIGNQNSRSGVPLTILRHTNEDVMVIEMGMSTKGQMNDLSLIVRPTIAIITNVLTAHIGNFKTRMDLLKAKLEIINGMKDGILIINNDNDLLNENYSKLKAMLNCYTYGIINKSNINAYNIRNEIETTFDINNIKDIKIDGGTSFIYNALASISVGNLLKVSASDIKDAICNSKKIKHRLEVINLKNSLLIDDTYNASYDSVKAALFYLSRFKGKKLVILADMLELGTMSKMLHEKLGKDIIESNISYLITIGKDSKEIGKSAINLGMNKNMHKHFPDQVSSRNYIKSIIGDYDVILVKGSNAFNLELLVKYIKEGAE